MTALFWLIAAAATAIVALGVGAPLWRGRAGPVAGTGTGMGTGTGDPEAGDGLAPDAVHDLRVYREQLDAVARDLARGTVTEDEAERLRTEIARRILQADRMARAGTPDGTPAEATAAAVASPDTARTRRPWAAMAVAGVVVAGALPLYWVLGAPGYPDLPIAERKARAEVLRAERPTQEAAEAAAAAQRGPAPEPDARYAELMDKLRAATAERPDDLTGQELLARNEAALGNLADAARAQARVVTLKGTAATATDYAALADLRVLAAGGIVTAEAEEALGEALRRDPKNGTARYYLGLMNAQIGRPDITFRLWRALLEEGPEEAPWIPVIRQEIGMLAQAAGVDYTPPPPPGAMPGPSAGDVAAAGEMDATDRQDMIRGMVERLNDRLATEGGTPEEWARLVTALGVLGETDRAKAIWDEAQTRFADRPEALATVRAAAAQAGLVE